jgi:hypothetical protein
MYSLFFLLILFQLLSIYDNNNEQFPMWSTWTNWSICERDCWSKYGSTYRQRHCLLCKDETSLDNLNQLLQCVQTENITNCSNKNDTITNKQHSICYEANQCKGYGLYTGYYTKWKSFECIPYANSCTEGSVTKIRKCLPSNITHLMPGGTRGPKFACGGDFSGIDGDSLINIRHNCVAKNKYREVWTTWSQWSCPSECKQWWSNSNKSINIKTNR